MKNKIYPALSSHLTKNPKSSPNPHRNWVYVGKRWVKKYFFILLLAELVFSYTPAFAQTPGDPADYRNAKVSSQIEYYLCAPEEVPKDQTQTKYFDAQGNPLTFNKDQAAFENNNQGVLYKCINKLYKFSIVLACVIGVFFIVIAGYVYIGSEGNQESVDKAKSILVSTITSLVILLSGYVLLKAINPDLIQFHSIQPPSVKVSQLPGWEAIKDGAGRVTSVKSSAGTYNALGTNDPSQVESAGCSFQDPERFKGEIAGVQASLFNAVVEICKAASPKGKIQISSVASGQHATASYHNKFCAVDFADGSGSFLTTEAGKAAKAKADQINGLRVNPGIDEDKINHMHIDVGTACRN